jgi:hypothetical protein
MTVFHGVIMKHHSVYVSDDIKLVDQLARTVKMATWLVQLYPLPTVLTKLSHYYLVSKVKFDLICGLR